MTADQQLDELGLIVHSVLAFGHVLGVAFNLQQRKWFWAGFHSGALAGDAYGAWRHIRALRESA